MAQQFYDITSTYINNGAFNEGINYAQTDTGNVSGTNIQQISGWHADDATAGVAGIFAFGSGKTFNGLHMPATGYDGNTTGGALVLSPEIAKALRFAQTLTLPAGNYKLLAHMYNASGADSTRAVVQFWWRPKRVTQRSRRTTLPSKEWVTDTLSITLTQTTTADVTIGEMVSNLKHADIVVDALQLLRDTPLGQADRDVLTAQLQTVADSASTLLKKQEEVNDASESLSTALQTALAALADSNTSLDDLVADYHNLSTLITVYNFEANTKVITNPAYARGATMAFGRMSVSGIDATDIAAQGFCYAKDNSNPTINDEVSQYELQNNGTIYWLKNLTPASKYFMRAYIKTNEGKVRYGKVIKFYTLPKGQITYNMRSGGDSATVARITNAVKTAVDYWNNLTEMKDQHFNVGYNSGTPTADCSYGGYIRVGSNTSYQATGTLLHEMLHGVGVIPYETQWYYTNLRERADGSGRGTGHWLGDRVTAVLSFWDNTTEQLNGDFQHMWPYGINGAFEDKHTDVLYIGNSLICQALGEDGLEHNYSHFSEPYYALDQEDSIRYYIKSEDAKTGRNDSYLVDRDGQLENVAMNAAEAALNDSAAWYITFTPSNQFYQFRNAATGRYITCNGVSFTTTETASPGDYQNLQLMKARINAANSTTQRGYWILRHAARNPKCLGSYQTTGRTWTRTFDIKNTATAQRWLIMTAAEAVSFEKALGIGTGIKTVTTGKATTSRTASGVYNLQGVKVADEVNGKLPAGLYIVNGKKVVVK